LRRLTLVLTIVLVAVALSTASAGHLSFPRHVDPLVLPERTNVLEVINLLTLASELLARLDVGSTRNVTQLLTAAPLPQAVREAHARFTEVFSRFTDYLNESATYLGLAEEALSRGELAVCREALRGAEDAIMRARATYVALRDVYAYFARLLSPAVATRAERVLENAAKALEEVTGKFNELGIRLGEVLARGLTEVLVEAYVSSTQVLYGDSVEVRGRVIDTYGRPLVGRRVVTSYSTYKWSALTGEGGFFSLMVPLYSCGNLALTVAYTPLGDDAYIYRYAEARLNLTVVCREPSLKLALPEVIYVGTSTALCVESDVDGLEVSVSITGANVNTTLKVSGPTCTNVLVPGDTREGVYKVSALSKPVRGVPPTRVDTYVRLAKIPVGVALHHPRFLLAGLPAELCIYAEVPSEIALDYSAKAEAPLRGTATCAKVEVPATYLELELPLRIYVKPLNSTYREVLLELSLPVVNPYVLALTTLAIALLIFLHRERGAYRSPEVGKALLLETPSARVAEVSPLVAEFVEVVRSVGGVELEGSMTLREYVEKPLSVVGETVREVLRRCLVIVERIVYGPQEGIETLVRELRELLRALRRGASAGLWLYVASGLLVSLAILSAVVYLVPSTDDLSPYNPLWNGLSMLVSELNASVISPEGISSLNPGSSVVLAIGVSEGLGNGTVEALRGFVQAGGVLVVADESPYSSYLVRSLGIGALLGEAAVADAVFFYRDPSLPLARASISLANFTLHLNYATYINTTKIDKCLAWTFPTSFLDLNLSGSREGHEPYGPFCVAYREGVGSGVVYLISDSSLFTNSMVGLGDNRAFLRAIVGSRSVYVLYEGGASPYSRFREMLLSTYSALFRTWLRYPLSIAIALGLYRLMNSARRKAAKLILPGLPYSSMKDFERVVKELGELRVDEE